MTNSVLKHRQCDFIGVDANESDKSDRESISSDDTEECAATLSAQQVEVIHTEPVRDVGPSKHGLILYALSASLIVIATSAISFPLYHKYSDIFVYPSPNVGHDVDIRPEVLDVSPYDFHSDESNVCPALGIQPLPALGIPPLSALGIQPLPALGIQPLIPMSQYVKSTEFSDINYASYARGARPIPTLVSATYQASGAKNFLRDWLGWVSHAPLPPETALKSNTETGECWPFIGKSGYIAIKLAEPIIITHIGYSHSAKNVTVAPRSIIVSGLLYQDDYLNGRTIPADIPTVKSEVLDAVQVVIANIEYDINAPFRTLTFPIIEKVRSSQLKFRAVLFNITDNWGSSEMTCLYQVRVHGKAI